MRCPECDTETQHHREWPFHHCGKCGTAFTVKDDKVARILGRIGWMRYDVANKKSRGEGNRK